MAGHMFQGASALTLDGKGRVAVPARHRDVLLATAGGQLTLTKHPQGCLMVFPRPAWEAFRDRVAALPMSASGWKRVFLGNAMDVEIDALVARARLARTARLGRASPRRDAARHGQPLRALGRRAPTPRTRPR